MERISLTRRRSVFFTQVGNCRLTFLCNGDVDMVQGLCLSSLHPFIDFFLARHRRNQTDPAGLSTVLLFLLEAWFHSNAIHFVVADFQFDGTVARISMYRR